MFGPYQIDRVVGRGASGRVLRAIDTRSGEPRAIKIVRERASMLFDEYAQLARLDHPALPRVFDVGRLPAPFAVDGIEFPIHAPYFVARWIDGAPIARAAVGDPARLWTILADLAGALAAIHAAGLVHGDVAPQNVLVDHASAVLVDLGLARATGARGTPAFMAPEAFAGFVEPRSDLYGLAATIARAVDGIPPHGDIATLGELVRRVTGTDARPALAGVPAPLADLVRRMLARDPAARPASALAVLEELDQIAPAIGARASGTPRRGRAIVAPDPAAWPGGAGVIDAIVAALGRESIIVVVGDGGSGARPLVDAAIARWQLALLARGEDAVPVARHDGLDAGTDTPSGRALAARTVRATDGIALVELGHDPRAPSAIAALAAAPGPAAVIAIVDALDDAGRAIVVPRLDAAGVAALATQMLGARPAAAWLRALHDATEGRILDAIDLVRAGDGATAPTARVRTARFAALAAPARRTAVAIVAWGGRCRIDRALATAGATLADLAELERTGLAHRSGDRVAIDRRLAQTIAAEADDLAATADAALRNGVSGEHRAAIADAALRNGVAANGALRDVVREADIEAAPLYEHASLASSDARDRAIAAAEATLVYGRADRALAIAKRLLDDGRGALIAARASAQLGAYADAERYADRARAVGGDAIAVRLAVARAAQRAGDLDRAETQLAALSREAPERDDVAGAYARLLVTRSRFAEARAIAGDATTGGLRAEAAGLAAFYTGDLDAADRAFAALEMTATAAGDRAAIGRALSLRGMVAQQRGQLALAADRYADAARRLDEVGELHAAATAELNLGTVLAERGRASDALPRLAAAARVFEELGATTELCAAELDRANALLAVGEARDAAVAAEAAIARASGAPHLRAFAMLVAGDARRRLGELAAAERLYRDALALAIARDDAHARLAAYIVLVEGGLAIDVAFDAIDALCASDDDRDRWLLARARAALVTTGTTGDLATLATACRAAGERAERDDRLDRAFRAHVLAALLAQRAGDAALVATSTERARLVHASIVAAAAPAFRAALAADPDLVALGPRPGTSSVVESSVARLAQYDAALLRRLLRLSRKLNTETNVQRILDEVIDTAIELASAERGFLLLRVGAELEVVVSRNLPDAELADATNVSRSIAERAATSGEPVITVDAGNDERFEAAASVAAMRLRSVLAVPLRQRGTIIGCVYVDHRFQAGAFDGAAASILGELADVAAVAIENARLTDDLRRTSGQLDVLTKQLSGELADRDAELVRARAVLPDRDRLGGRYAKIVGRSAAMTRMLGVVDRAASTSLPVVIVGESGTGKELVARALHDHGPRVAGPFVAINCGALPEQLLESELFGHVRGAFTGADRDRRGMFEVADGGTLFLDEIADTSAAMQAKLLRVLSDGQVRRVGETTTKLKTVDVRVVVATQRSLADLVTAGSFREDLRYRLEVIAIAIPPLRDRDGDLPMLVEALLALLCRDRPTTPRLTRAAMRALAAHRWPGNVRELDNALARGVAMGGDVIDIGDLPDSIVRSASAAAGPSAAKPAADDDLRLKPAIAVTEQAYIRAAMERAKGNQTVAARLLGLSRFGLQKKLRRLAGEDDSDDD